MKIRLLIATTLMLATSLVSAAPSVVGLTITWPDDGWYQVQKVSGSGFDKTFVEVCQGGRSCDVPAGSYSVINHATGMRWTDIIVDGPVALLSVDVDITVPAYKSNELQVSVVWGELNIPIAWSVDEYWAGTEDLPVLTEHPLVVTFYDRNGAIVLGRYERNYKTGTGGVDVLTVTADQFNTAQFDDDHDGRNNLDELIAGTDPLVPDTETTGDFNLADVSIDLLNLAPKSSTRW